MNKSLLKKIVSGLSDKNIRFGELRNMLLSLGFSERIRGGHHIFSKDEVADIINLQPMKDGKAKAYQVKQVRTIIIKYELHKGV